MRGLLETRSDFALTLARVAAGAVMLPHGLQKTLGWFGGHGYSASMAYFTDTMGIPAPFAFLALVAETLGALGLIFGFLSRVSAFGVGATMLVAMLMAQLPNGFFMNWFGNQKGEGIEFSLLMLGLTGITILRGGGAWAVDGWIVRHLSPARARHATGTVVPV
ncbi:MAG: DoxX family protein [Fimbriimonas sp.]